MHAQPAADIAKPVPAYMVKAAGAGFGSHTEDHQPPSEGRVLALTGWAGISIFIGLIPAGRLVVSLALRTEGWWYPIATASVGLLGMALIAWAFGAIRRARLPWSLMAIATLLLAANVAMAFLTP